MPTRCRQVAERFPADDTIRTLYAESAMDTQPWDYWEPAAPRRRAAAPRSSRGLETVLKRNPTHPGAIHLYIHAVEASTAPERALPYARPPGRAHARRRPHRAHAGAHLLSRRPCIATRSTSTSSAIAVDERYFKTSPSDPLYKIAYYPHNIHFVMVSAQMGGDGATAIDAATKLDAAVPAEVAKQFAIMEPVKASPYTTHAHLRRPGHGAGAAGA